MCDADVLLRFQTSASSTYKDLHHAVALVVRATMTCPWLEQGRGSHVTDTACARLVSQYGSGNTTVEVGSDVVSLGGIQVPSTRFGVAVAESKQMAVSRWACVSCGCSGRRAVAERCLRRLALGRALCLMAFWGWALMGSRKSRTRPCFKAWLPR